MLFWTVFLFVCLFVLWRIDSVVIFAKLVNPEISKIVLLTCRWYWKFYSSCQVLGCWCWIGVYIPSEKCMLVWGKMYSLLETSELCMIYRDSYCPFLHSSSHCSFWFQKNFVFAFFEHCQFYLYLKNLLRIEIQLIFFERSLKLYQVHFKYNCYVEILNNLQKLY